MSWDDKRFEELAEQVLATLAGKNPAIDLPYFRFLYGPGEGIEQVCIREFQDLAMRIRAKGFTAETLFLSSWVLELLKRLRWLEEDSFELERHDRSGVGRDLRRALSNGISEKLIQHLGGKGTSHCAILLRVGFIFPFVHVSSLLSEIEGRVNCMLVIPYPGSEEGWMLWFDRGPRNGYYRWITK